MRICGWPANVPSAVADAERVLDEAIEEFAEKARSFGKRDQLLALAELVFKAGEAIRQGKDVPAKDYAGLIHPSRQHDLKSRRKPTA